MGYYDEPVNRADKAGAKRTEHYESSDQELDEAKRADQYQMRTDAFAEGDGYLGVDDLDRLRREKLKHETR
jgi:hypothetical protein